MQAGEAVSQHLLGETGPGSRLASSCFTRPVAEGWRLGARASPAGWEPGLPLPDNRHTQVLPWARCLLSHMLPALSDQEGDPKHQVTCRRSQESRLPLQDHTEPRVAATDLCEAGRAPDTRRWSHRVQVHPLPCPRAGLVPAQCCGGAGNCQAAVQTPLHCPPCPAPGSGFGLQPRRPLLVLPKLGCPLLHCASCSPARFPHLRTHPCPASAPWVVNRAG